MKTNPLRIIKTTHRPVVDLYAAWREEIETRDWSRVHIQGDRNPPLWIPDFIRRPWRG